MNLKGKDPKEICLKLLKRSKCTVQVAAVLVDKDQRIHAWGWNYEGQDGFGEHAEIHCLKRANFKRVKKSTMYVASRRKKSSNPVNSKPCAACWPLVQNCAAVVYREKDGTWKAKLTNQIF